ncbi:hypothetical protein VNO77_02324 [Canavalia gladiata]|uniref:Uncharacterized protein n=1 Tax=Canavalia gladiata TaxID=3824 RepID=A0AAN9MZ85_CANGL
MLLHLLNCYIGFQSELVIVKPCPVKLVNENTKLQHHVTLEVQQRHVRIGGSEHCRIRRSLESSMLPVVGLPYPYSQ